MIHDLGRLEDYPDGAVTLLDVKGREVGVVRWGSDLYAVGNVCPHQSGPVCAGLVRPAIVSGGGPGRLGLAEEVPVLACPWHGWEFDARTGACIAGGRGVVNTYPVRADGDRLVVELPDRIPRRRRPA